MKFGDDSSGKGAIKLPPEGDTVTGSITETLLSTLIEVH